MLKASIAITCLGLFAQQTLAATFSSVDRGWYSEFGVHDPFNENTLTGLAEEKEYRSFFLFDLSALTGPVASVQLQIEIEAYYSFANFASAKIWDVDALNASSLTVANGGIYGVSIFNDLGSGSSYGEFTISTPLKGRYGAFSPGENILTIELNPTSITDVIAAGGTLFALGISLEPVSGASSEWIRFSDGGQFAAPRTQNLIVSSVPIPAALWLFGSAVFTLVWLKRKAS